MLTSARRALTVVAVLLLAVALPAGAVVAQVFPLPAAVPGQGSPTAGPSGSASPRPSSTRLQPTQQPSASAAPSESPRRTADPTPSPSRTRTSPSRSASASAFATLPAPSFGPVQTSPVLSPAASVSADPPGASPTPVPVAGSGSTTGEGLERLVTVALSLAVLLGVAGAAGLYLTREPS